MRLLNTQTIELKEFADDHYCPPYAILSHRWQDQEVLYEGVIKNTGSHRAGHEKMKASCKKALEQDLQYIWIDTCCINKDSSAELSESINSMYRWYYEAAVCYAYLADVACMREHVKEDKSFSHSVWWKRGWTLQELIAPERVEFYNRHWEFLGTKDDLQDQISEITNIQRTVLAGRKPEDTSIAQRMSWASARETTRIEDMVYSLLGLFDVNMPMLYGEGDKAFMRLQEEIMRRSDDQSLFAWTLEKTGYHGLLAQSPSQFAGCSAVTKSTTRLSPHAYSLSNVGLSIELPLFPCAIESYIAVLDCEINEYRIGICLANLDQHDRYARMLLDKTLSNLHKERIVGEDPVTINDSHGLIRIISKVDMRFLVRKSLIVRQKNEDQIWRHRKYSFWLRTPPPLFDDPRARDTLDKLELVYLHGKQDQYFFLPFGTFGIVATLRNASRLIQSLTIGLNEHSQPFCKVVNRAHRAFEAELLEKEHRTFVGDRYRGLAARHDGLEILIRKEKIVEPYPDGALVWVLDIKDPTPIRNLQVHQAATSHSKYQCSSCSKPMHIARFKCATCKEKTNFCIDCMYSEQDRHDTSHTIEVYQKICRVEASGIITCLYCPTMVAAIQALVHQRQGRITYRKKEVGQ